MNLLDSLAPLVAVVGTLVFLFAANSLAPKFNLIDHPDNGRKRHNGVVPLTGGIAIFLSLVLAIAISGQQPNGELEPLSFWAVVGTLLAVLIIAHVLDDIFDLNTWVRLGVDALLALLICVFASMQITTLGNMLDLGPATLGRFAIPMAIFSLVAASNAYNWADGIDGLCTGLGFVALLGLIGLLMVGGNPMAGPLIDILTIVIFALIPAYLANVGLLGARLRSFLGDSGARLIGFIIGLAVILAAEHKFIHPVMVFFPMAVPISDCLILMATRIAKGRSPLSADRQHLHHLLIDAGLSTAMARRSIIVLGIVIAGIGINLQINQTPDWIVSIVVVVLFWGFIGLRIWVGRIAQKRVAVTS